MQGREAGGKSRHAAALAFLGWYLMFPPVDYRNSTVLSTTSFKYWENYRSFDSAIECNDFRDANISRIAAITSEPIDEQEERHDDQVLKWGVGTSKKNRGIGLKRARASLCIATDDPRLKGN
jgi:hypothetical protein